MITISRNIAVLLSATALLMPATARAGDPALLVTEAAGTFRLVDEAVQPAPSAAPPEAKAGDAVRPAQGSAAASPDAVELAALYYYAQQKQDGRVSAEAARLRFKYPGFELPQDLFAPVVARNVDESSLWALFEKNDFTGIDAEIVRRKTEMPDWTPTADFSEKLAKKKQRVLMTEATAARDWAGVIAAGAAIDPAKETEADLLWMLIDAHAETGARTELSVVYRGILMRQGEVRLPDPVLLTTLQKAVRDFPATEVQTVMAGLATTPASIAAFQPVMLDLARKRIADFNADKTAPAPLAEADLAPVTAAVAQTPAASDMALLGWYFLKIKQHPAAADWFGKALALSPDAQSAKGLYLSLAEQGLTEDAYKVAAGHLQDLSGDPEFLMNALSLRFSKPDATPIDEKVVAAYSTTILETLNADHAEILAWYAYNAKQYEAAAAWFGKSIDWNAAAPRVKGLALSYLRLSDKQDFAALKEKYGDVYKEIWAEIDASTPPKGAGASAAVDKPRSAVEANYMRNFKAKRYGACVSDLEDLKERGQLTSAAALIGGWCYLSLGRAAEARAFFAPGLEGSGKMRADAAYGTALALLRGKLTGDAEAILAAYPMTADRDREIRAEIYVQRARAAFDRKNYRATLEALSTRAGIVAEPADLSQLRGWAYYHLGDRRTANEVFQRLSEHLSDPAIRRGLLVTSRMETTR